ncbi:MAG TPA: hypothetical protein VHP14_15365 [Anaerolineales bacterium]|nr:hypothetical protein [Anaerolineales bacterium]
MSENIAVPVHTRKLYIKILLLVAAVLILLLVYGAGMVVLPFSIQTSFWNKNCNLVLTLDKTYTGLYPESIRDETLSGPVQECEAYELAASKEKDQNWREAYDNYQAYLSTYPSGLYAAEAYEHSAVALVGIAKEQMDRKEYEDAVANLNLVTTNYSDTDISAEVWTLLPSVYISWGADLREAGDFTKAQQVLDDFKNWSLTYQRNDSVIDAQRELVQMYLTWSLELQSQKQFESALAKLELAAAADPQSQTDSAAQIKASESGLFVEWGNDLLRQKKFPEAIEKLKQAASRAEVDRNGDARDALANGYIQWASALSGTEDFRGALEQLDLAAHAASSDTVKKSVDTALQATYLAFSKSTGQQAQRALKEALQAVCEDRQTTALPILGLDKDSTRFGIYGAEDQLPEDLIARTPGEVHYVACITAENRTVQTREHKNIVLKVRGGYYYTLVQQYRVQIIWNVRLVQVDTGKSVAEQTFAGAQPPPFPEEDGTYFHGPTPMDEFTEWLRTFIQ